MALQKFSFVTILIYPPHGQKFENTTLSTESPIIQCNGNVSPHKPCAQQSSTAHGTTKGDRSVSPGSKGGTFLMQSVLSECLVASAADEAVDNLIGRSDKHCYCLKHYTAHIGTVEQWRACSHTMGARNKKIIFAV